MEKVRVNAPSREYDILIGWDILHTLGKELTDRGLVKSRRPVAILTSPRIGNYYFDAVRLSLEKNGILNLGRYNIPDGEEHKNLKEYCEAVKWLSRFSAGRGLTPLVITLGGGVVGDLGGFVAHTYRRGTPFVQVTTTLLGAVDCSVGGKVAVNLPAGKNLAGAFHQPSMVLADLCCLKTLPKNEIRSGLAEVIKYGAALDESFFRTLEQEIDGISNLAGQPLVEAVKLCCEIKARTVQQDELDSKGVRVSLNFGHTFAHALERVCRYRLSHGDCVAIGMVAAAQLSVSLDLCTPDTAARLKKLLEAAGLPVIYSGKDVNSKQILEVMKHDKKWVHGKNRFVLLNGIGDWTECEGVDMQSVRQVVEQMIDA